MVPYKTHTSVIHYRRAAHVLVAWMARLKPGQSHLELIWSFLGQHAGMRVSGIVLELDLPQGSRTTFIHLHVQVAAIPFLWPAFMANPAHQVPFYQDASGDELLSSVPGSHQEAAPVPSAAIRAGPSRETVQAAVSLAIQSVLGPGVGSGTPLVQAGLDSLGERFHLSKYPIFSANMINGRSGWYDMQCMCELVIEKYGR